MTSLLRDEVSVPVWGCRSSRSVLLLLLLLLGEEEWEWEARARAMARPTAPPPMTCVLGGPVSCQGLVRVDLRRYLCAIYTTQAVQKYIYIYISQPVRKSQ